MGSSRQSSNQRSQSTPWGPQVPHLKRIYSEAERLYGDKIDYFPGSTIAARDPRAAAGLDMVAGAAGGGSQALTAGAVQHGQDVLGGQYLDPASNPWLSKTYDMAASKVGESFNRIARPGMLTGSGRGRRIGGSSHFNRDRMLSDTLGDQLGELATSIYGGNYQAERGRMQQMAGMAGGIAAGAYAPGQALYGAGVAAEEYAQRRLDDEVARHGHEEGEGWQRLSLYKEHIGRPVSGTTSGKASTSRPFSWFGLRG